MKIGFIGLGVMGKPMARNLMKAGYSLVICSSDSEKRKQFAEEGATVAVSYDEVASSCSVIVTMLPNSPQVKEVVLGPKGVLSGAQPGTILIDMSSIAPAASQEIYAACAEKGVKMIDAPVSGGEPMAISRTLSIMAGGDKDVFEKVKDILLAVGSSVIYCGAIGSGNTVKLANQIIVACNIAACSEAYVLAKKAGVDPNVVFQAINGGLAGSNVMNAKVPMMLKGDYKPGFRISLHVKDLQNALDVGSEKDMPLPMSSLVMDILHSLMEEGYESCDHSAIVKYYEKIGDTVLSE